MVDPLTVFFCSLFLGGSTVAPAISVAAGAVALGAVGGAVGATGVAAATGVGTATAVATAVPTTTVGATLAATLTRTEIPPILGPNLPPSPYEMLKKVVVYEALTNESSPLVKFMASVVDNIFRDKVREPELGSVLFCDLHMFEHSGIYIGKNQIVHLDGSGKIEIVSPRDFIHRLGGGNTAMSIYVCCEDTKAVGSKEVAMRAISMIGRTINYNVFNNNCHQFTAGCLSGDFGNSNALFAELIMEVKKTLKSDTARIWDLSVEDLFPSEPCTTDQLPLLYTQERWLLALESILLNKKLGCTKEN